MPSSYTPSLRLTLPQTGELSGTWGTTVNTGITSLTDQAIAGTASITMTADTNYTLSVSNGTSDESRNMFITVGGGPHTVTTNVICPAVSKMYVVTNSTVGGKSIVFKTASGTGITVPNGQRLMLYCNGTDVVSLATASAAGINGSTTTSSAVDITLTNASTQGQLVTMTAGSKSVILPDATTISVEGGVVFQITNQGATPFSIKDGSGNVIYPLVTTGTTLGFQLIDNSTTAGNWGVANNNSLSPYSSVAVGPVYVFNAAGSTNPAGPVGIAVAGLSSTQFVAIAYNSAGSAVLRLYTVSGTTVTSASNTSITAYPFAASIATTSNSTLPVQGNSYQILALSSTSFVVASADSSGRCQFTACTVSGTTVTVGSSSVQGTNQCYGASLALDSAGKFVAAWTEYSAATSYVRTVAATVSGTTITFGTIQSASNASSSVIGAPILVRSSAASSYYSTFWCYNYQTYYESVYTLSGTTLTSKTTNSFNYAANTAQLLPQYFSHNGGAYVAFSPADTYVAIIGRNGYKMTIQHNASSMSFVNGNIDRVGAGIAHDNWYSIASPALGAPFGSGYYMLSYQHPVAQYETQVFLYKSDGALNVDGFLAATIAMPYGNWTAKLDATTNVIVGVYNDVMTNIGPCNLYACIVKAI